MSGRFGFLHPSNGRLRTWLDDGIDEGVGVHVEQCDRCADRLADFADDLSAPDDDATLRRALAELWTPPTDLGDRLLLGVEQRQRAEREVALLAGLFAVGIETVQLLLQPAADQDQGGHATDDLSKGDHP